MIVFDANLLISAFRDDHPHHRRVRPWLDQLLATRTRFAVPDLVWVAVVRICTNPRVFPIPSAVSDVADFVRALLAQPGYVQVGGLRNGVDVFLAAAVDSDARANLAADAYIAAVATEWGAAVATLDRDFRRFDGLRTVEPPVAPAH